MITEEMCCKRTLQSLGKKLVNVYSFFALVEKVVYMPCGICHVEDYYAMSYRRTPLAKVSKSKNKVIV